MQNLNPKTEMYHLGEGISLVRDMFVAETMEEAEKLAGKHIIRLYEVGLSLERLGQPYGSWMKSYQKQNINWIYLNYDFLT